ncbi:MAG TPA: hypothetical protein PKA55_20275 [Rhodoblastus sp.]|nr:hypothetical protein [Rhodoblastus sp.]
MAFKAFLTGAVASLSLLAFGGPASADMQFSLTTIGGNCGAHCPQAIVADGEITDATPDEFVAFVRANSRAGNVRSVVLLNSPGGKVVASMELGRVFRKVGAATIVARAVSDSEGRSHLAAGRCFSACVYALMGGRKRVVPAQSLVGIHRMFALEAGADPAGGSGGARRRFDNGDMRDTLARYSQAMGVSRDLINRAESTPTESIHVLSPQEVARWRLGSSRF